MGGWVGGQGSGMEWESEQVLKSWVDVDQGGIKLRVFSDVAATVRMRRSILVFLAAASADAFAPSAYFSAPARAHAVQPRASPLSALGGQPLPAFRYLKTLFLR